MCRIPVFGMHQEALCSFSELPIDAAKGAGSTGVSQNQGPVSGLPIVTTAVVGCRYRDPIIYGNHNHTHTHTHVYMHYNVCKRVLSLWLGYGVRLCLP